MNNDLISREALKKALANNTLIRDFNLQFDGIIGEIIDNAPTVTDHSAELVQKSIELGRRVGKVEEAIESKRPQGEWYFSCEKGWECNQCHKVIKEMPTCMRKATYNFCPNCGADMRKGGAE